MFGVCDDFIEHNDCKYQELTMVVVNTKTCMPESLSKGKGLLSQMLATKGPGPGTCNLNHQQQGWMEKTACPLSWS